MPAEASPGAYREDGILALRNYVGGKGSQPCGSGPHWAPSLPRWTGRLVGTADRPTLGCRRMTLPFLPLGKLSPAGKMCPLLLRKQC